MRCYKVDRLEKLYDLILQKKKLEEEIKEIHESMLEEIKEIQCKNIKFEDEHIQVSYVPASSYKTLDTSKLKSDAIYKDLLEQYPKTVDRKAYLKVKIK